MAVTYVCPKCSGTDVYFAKKQVVKGLGGIYGSHQKEVQRPFCRNCDIEAEATGRDTDGMKKFWVIYARIAVVVAVVVLSAWLYVEFF